MPLISICMVHYLSFLNILPYLFIFILHSIRGLGAVLHVFNTSPQEVVAKITRVPGHPGLLSETTSQKKFIAWYFYVSINVIKHCSLKNISVYT